MGGDHSSLPLQSTSSASSTLTYLQVKVARPSSENAAARGQFFYAPSAGVVELHSALLASYHAIENALLKTSVDLKQQQQNPFNRPSVGSPGGHNAACSTGTGPAADPDYRIRLPSDTASMVARYTQELSDKMCRLIADKKAASDGDSGAAATASDERRNDKDCQTRL